TVATYKAPARAKPGVPGAVTVALAGGETARASSFSRSADESRRSRAGTARRALTITWKPAKGAARYGVRVALPDGRKLFFLRDADDRSVRIADAPADGRVIV